MKIFQITFWIYFFPSSFERKILKILQKILTLYNNALFYALTTLKSYKVLSKIDSKNMKIFQITFWIFFFPSSFERKY
jgi:hypothetical protein